MTHQESLFHSRSYLQRQVSWAMEWAQTQDDREWFLSTLESPIDINHFKTADWMMYSNILALRAAICEVNQFERQVLNQERNK